MFFTPIKRSLYRITVPILVTILFFSCQKELSVENGNIVVTPPDLTTKIKSSVSGFVTDENEAPVTGATVQFGASSTTTDKYGYFEVRNVQIVKIAAVVTVSKTGYFKGIKTYAATEGKSAFFRIKLIPKTTVGNINAATGGNVTLSNGLSIVLPAGAVMNAATNAPYTGTVNVAAYWINPEAADLDRVMPGDLRAINTDGALKLLKTFGMAAVELTGSGGELLQILTGKTATLTFPIPSSLMGDAPSSIPLWYFDESNGLWKEQGSAVKTGNAYTGDVTHFSYWNCDFPFPNAVQFDCTVVDALGHPVPYQNVSISYSNGQYTGCHGYTDSLGWVGGNIPANSQLILQVFGSGCFTPLVAVPFTTTNANIFLGNISVANSPLLASITGNLIDCNAQPVTNGYVILFVGNTYLRFNVSNSNSFYFNVTLCGSNTVTLIGGDIPAAQEGYLNNYPLVSGNNNIGGLVACGTSTVEFVNYTIDGIPLSITPANGYISQSPDSSIINSVQVSAYQNNNASILFAFSKLNISPGSIQDLTNFNSVQTGQTTISGTIPVSITEYGNLGQYIAGSFTGSVISVAPPNTVHTISCNFRFKRYY